MNVIAVEYPGYGLLQGIEPAEEDRMGLRGLGLRVLGFRVSEFRV